MSKDPISPDYLSSQLIALVCGLEPAEVAHKIIDIAEQIGQFTIAPANGTKMICSVCNSVNASAYKLRRSGGKYLAYCVDELGGCAGKEIYPQCSFKDYLGIECDQLAEYQMFYGAEELITRYACVLHAGILLKDAKNTVYPIR